MWGVGKQEETVVTPWQARPEIHSSGRVFEGLLETLWARADLVVQPPTTSTGCWKGWLFLAPQMPLPTVGCLQVPQDHQECQSSFGTAQPLLSTGPAEILAKDPSHAT